MHTASVETTPPPPPPLRERQALPSGWSQRTSRSGVVFFFNEVTRERSYTRPRAANLAASLRTSCSINRGKSSEIPSLFQLCTRAIAVVDSIQCDRTYIPSHVADEILSSLQSENLICANTLSRVLKYIGKSLTCFAVPNDAPSPARTTSSIAEFCQNLRILALNRCGKLSTSALEQIARSNPCLQVIDVSECPQITSAAVGSLGALCTNLTSLSCGHCMSITGCLEITFPGLAFLNISGTCIDSLVLTCPNLEHLNCSECGVISSITSKVAMTALSYLVVFKCRLLGPETFLPFIQSTQGAIRELNLTECYAMDSVSLSKLCLMTPNVTHMNMARCSIDEGVIASLGTCHELSELHLTDCKCTSPSLVGLGECHNLQLVSFPPNTTSEMILPLSTKLSSLTVANMVGIPHIRGNAISVLIKNCPMLSTLNISDCLAIDDTAFYWDESPKPESPIDSGTPKINPSVEAQTCNLSVITAESVPLTDTALINISHQCPNLTTIDFSRNSHLTDHGIAALVKNCPLLSSIVLQFCTQLTDSALLHLSSNKSELLVVDIFECSQISPAGVISLLQSRKVVTLNCSQSVYERVLATPDSTALLKTTKLCYGRSNY